MSVSRRGSVSLHCYVNNISDAQSVLLPPNQNKQKKVQAELSHPQNSFLYLLRSVSWSWCAHGCYFHVRWPGRYLGHSPMNDFGCSSGSSLMMVGLNLCFPELRGFSRQLDVDFRGRTTGKQFVWVKFRIILNGWIQRTSWNDHRAIDTLTVSPLSLTPWCSVPPCDSTSKNVTIRSQALGHCLTLGYDSPEPGAKITFLFFP